MSMLLTAQAMKLKVGNPTRKLVLLKLADNANDKGECFPSYQHIADHCEVSRRSVISHIDALIKMGLVEKKSRKNQDGSSSNLYILHLEKGSENISPPSERISPPSENSSLPPSENISPITNHSINQSINHIDLSLQTKTSATSPTKKFSFTEMDLAMAKDMFARIQKLNPNHKQPNFEAWANDIRLLGERDGKSHSEIIELFEWANQDRFWQANILSPRKLREKWDVLVLQRNRQAKPRGDNLSMEWNTAEAWENVL
nr:MAG TPA: replication protein O [Caudoviricetes sp.]